MKNKILIIFIVIFFTACARIDPFVLTKRLNPNYEQVKIFWSDAITEVTFNNQIIKTQGAYYLLPKKYKLTWKYQIIKENETVYKWKSAEIDLENVKEIHFEKEKIIKK